MKTSLIRVFSDNSLPSGFKVALDSKELETAAIRAVGKDALPEEINIIFVDNDKIRELNKNYRKIDRPTDVLSFNYEGEIEGQGEKTYNESTGEIYVSIPYVIESAKVEGMDINKSAAAVVVHGILHLAGFDHETKKDAETMKHFEQKITASLKREIVSVSCSL